MVVGAGINRILVWRRSGFGRSGLLKLAVAAIRASRPPWSVAKNVPLLQKLTLNLHETDRSDTIIYKKYSLYIILPSYINLRTVLGLSVIKEQEIGRPLPKYLDIIS